MKPGWHERFRTATSTGVAVDLYSDKLHVVGAVFFWAEGDWAYETGNHMLWTGHIADKVEYELHRGVPTKEEAMALAEATARLKFPEEFDT